MGKVNIKETELLLKEWETVISTQMHFNEMIIRARTTGVSVVMAVYGAAALAIGQYPGKFLKISGSQFHVSTAIIFFGLCLLLAIFFMDIFYYYRLLLGAVERGIQIDNAFQGRKIGGTALFGMTTLISKKVSECRSTFLVVIFYAIPFVIGILALIYLIFSYCP
jgi:hypothetical protein